MTKKLFPNRIERDIGFFAVIGLSLWNVLTLGMEGPKSHSIWDEFKFVGSLVVYAYVLADSIRQLTTLINMKYPGYKTTSAVYDLGILFLGFIQVYSVSTMSRASPEEFMLYMIGVSLSFKHIYDCSYYD